MNDERLAKYRLLLAIGYALFALFLLSTPPSTVFAEEEPSAYALALVAYHDRQLDRALTHAKQAVRDNPEHADAHFLLGELYYLRQELSKAKESWERALKLAPSRHDIRERLEKLQREEQVERGLARSDTHPFVVRFAEGQTPVDLGTLKQILRDTYRMVGQQFQYFPDHPITVIFYPESDFEKVKGISHRVSGLYDGKIRLPLRRTMVEGSLPATEELKWVLWHEYTHAVVHDLSKGRCPTWLNEGLASLQEARVHSLDLGLFRKTLQAGNLMLWNQLWTSPYEAARMDFLYSEAYLVARYLVERWGWEKMVGCLKRLGEGYPIEDALKAEYKTPSEVIEKEWVAWLKRRL